MLAIGRFLMISGIVLLVVGGMMYFAGRYGLPFFRLPGDIRIEGQNFTCVFPLVTSILLSILLTVLLNVVVRFLNR